MTPESTPDLSTFTAEAEAFVAAHHRRRSADDATALTSYSVLPEKAAAVERRELAEALRWRQECFDAGFGWIDGPDQYGGRGLPPAYAEAYRSVERQFEVPDEAYTRFSVAILCPTLLHHGTAALRDEFLRPLRRADLVSCQLFSEPGAGSDMASASTRATREGDDWVVTGQKVWTSGAHYSQVGLVLARTTPGSHRNAGLTAFLIDMNQPGIEVRPIRQLTGGSSFSEVFLDGARVPEARRVGEVGAGWQVITTTMRFERAIIGTEGGVDLAFADRLIALAKSNGRWDDPHIRDQIGEILVRGRSAVHLTQRLLDEADGTPGAALSMSKLLLTDNLGRIADVAHQILGYRLAVDTAEAETYAWNQLALSLEGLRIGGGTDEIMRTIIAQRVLGLPR